MNVDNINTVIAMIRAEEVAKFDMCSFGEINNTHPCGTAGCIAGFAAIANGTDIRTNDANIIENSALEFMGLPYEYSSMFLGGSTHKDDIKHNYMNMSFIKAEDAVAMLENLRDTGVINWTICPNYK